ncbi:Arm DNA-binding domain-containing protein [Pseudomonas sp. NY11955]|uniref:Arm DNA-binding domain-containing protein n=1 Tax=Pseudomonas sp. NY11955 TaxID=3400363 RepID=UPI003A8C87AD
MSFGSYPQVGLRDARTRRDEARTLIAQGTNPSNSGMPNRHFRKSHGDLLNLPEAKCSSRQRSCSIEKPNWGLSHSGLKSGLKMRGYPGCRWFSLERKKGLSALFSTTYRLPWNSVDL